MDDQVLKPPRSRSDTAQAADAVQLTRRPAAGEEMTGQVRARSAMPVLVGEGGVPKGARDRRDGTLRSALGPWRNGPLRASVVTNGR
jgi:hypothetical protein